MRCHLPLGREQVHRDTRLTQLARATASAGISHNFINSSISTMKCPTPTLSFLLLTFLPALAVDTVTPPANTSYIDELGLTHITRVVPSPSTISPEAQAKLIKPTPSILMSGASLAEQRAKMDARQEKDAAACLQLFPATVTTATMAGVPVRVITSLPEPTLKDDRVLLNIHGGGFRVDSGSLLESIPIAHLAKIKVVSVLYRMAPENPFPASVDDVVAVYQELLKTYPAAKIAIYGTSAGAVITAETAARLKQLGLPLPAALGVFSGFGDFSQAGDSMSLFGLSGLSGNVMPRSAGPLSPDYVGKTNSKDPVLSPTYSDLRGLPPTLFVTSTRDMLLSGTVLLHQAFLHAGVDSRLHVYEALPHAFWLDASLPESRAADEAMAKFLSEHLKN